MEYIQNSKEDYQDQDQEQLHRNLSQNARDISICIFIWIFIRNCPTKDIKNAKESNSPPCLALKNVIALAIVLLLLWKEKDESEVVWRALKSVIAKAQKFLRGKSYHCCNRLSPKFHKNFHQLINSLLRRGRSHTKVDRVHKYQTSSSCSLYNYTPRPFYVDPFCIFAD